MGPLRGITIIEFTGIGPGPFCGMMLSDMGARVIRIDRPRPGTRASKDALSRGRESIALDLQDPQAVEIALRLIERADGLFEGYRPGVMERFGLGPEPCLERNPRLVYGRMTGWGQEGPLAQAAGHDTNYIALAGVLSTIGRPGEPPPMPLNLIGDFGGGGMLLAFGMVCALLEARSSGQGQIVDAAMVDGAATLMALIYALHSNGLYAEERESNFLDGGSHFAGSYETKDGRYITICSLEPQFYALLLEKLGLDKQRFAEQMKPTRWPEYKAELTALFKTRTRDEWCAILEGTDVCFAPVLTLSEAPQHPHNRVRGTFTVHDGFLQPGPSPRFSRTKAAIQCPSRAPGADTASVLQELGYSAGEIEELTRSGAAYASEEGS